MQDSAPGWTRYIEDLETQAASLRRRRTDIEPDVAPPEARARLWDRARAGLRRLGALLAGRVGWHRRGLRG
jgi:hypothetical protein